MNKNEFCIPNLFCVNYYFIVIILLISLIYIALNKMKSTEIVKKVYIDKASEQIDKRPQDERPDLYRKLYDKLEEPTRKYLPINIPTRGETLPYQVVGYVYREETDANYNPEDVNRMILYGRPEYRGSTRYEYYITLPDDLIKIPLDNKEEIFTGDIVSVKGFTGDFIAEVYEYQQYKYIPYIY